MLTTISARPGRSRALEATREGTDVANPAPLEGNPIWDPVAWSWPLFGILLALLAAATIGFIVWTVLHPDEPEHDTDELVDKAVRRDRERAHTIERRLDADSGRADTSEPELR